MALTKVSTDGVKDDAITKTKIPANQIEASELADNAVDTNAIANDAVTVSKIQNVAQDRILGRQSSGTGDLQELNAGNVRLMLNVADGANQTTINNNADNRVITGSGTANTLNGESLVTVDSNGRMTIGLTVGGVCLTASSAGSTYGGALRLINTISSNHEWTIAVGGGDNAYVAGRGLLFRDETTGINHTQLQTNGNIRIVDGDLQVASGHGIDFSPNTNATGASSEVLDDYEEGTFNAPYYQGGNLVANADGRYTKIGNRVFISIFEFVGGQSTKQDKDMLYITGLPFTARSEPNSLGTIARYGGGNHQTIGTAEHCYIAQGGTQIKFDDTFNTGTGNWTVSLVYEAS